MRDTYILGISAFYHDSAACWSATARSSPPAQEERFTRKKGDPRFRRRRSSTASELAGITRRRPRLRRLLRQAAPQVRAHPRDLPRRRAARVPVVPDGRPAVDQGEAVHRSAAARRRSAIDGEILYTEHHESHAASAFFPSPFEEAAILTMDGVGEWATASIGVGRGNDIEILDELHWPDSLGLLYSAFTYYTGSRSTPANTRSWASPRTASRSTSI